MLEYLHNGLDWPDVALTIDRATIGALSVISGYHKLCRRRTFLQWLLPGMECTAGVALTVGLFTIESAALLLAICFMEYGYKIATCNPVNKALEVLYILILLTVMLAGPTLYSMDYLIRKLT